MAITVDERRKSRVVGDKFAEFQFLVMGTEDHAAAKAALEGEAPTTVNGMPRSDVRVEEIGAGKWDGIATYGSQPGPAPETGSSVFSFDIGGGTQHITQSIETINSYSATDDDPPDFQGAIGVSDTGVEGVDIGLAAFNFSEIHYIADAAVTTAYKKLIADLAFKVNASEFRGFAAGEVLFLGASGSTRVSPSGAVDWEITFKFSRSQNVTARQVGAMSIDKKGWEYLWVLYREISHPAGSGLRKAPVAAYVEKTYESGNFSGLGI